MGKTKLFSIINLMRISIYGLSSIMSAHKLKEDPLIWQSNR